MSPFLPSFSDTRGSPLPTAWLSTMLCSDGRFPHRTGDEAAAQPLQLPGQGN